ncbi:hypothetical protein ACJIZ3_003301 [Penstemon smallii]|uniref:Uncharacterized protein n=1 Tax=Penstemon smallii TaxID=265156 RepID=A0ABD3UCL7_9LAMI
MVCYNVKDLNGAWVTGLEATKETALQFTETSSRYPELFEHLLHGEGAESYISTLFRLDFSY